MQLPRKGVLVNILAVLSMLHDAKCQECSVYPSGSLISVQFAQEKTLSCVCSAKALTISWLIDGEDSELYDAIVEEFEYDGNFLVSRNITVPASPDFNNISFHCKAVLQTRETVEMPKLVFIVLGIGWVPIIELISAMHTPLTCIQWGEPVFVSTNVKDLMYNVSVSGGDLPPFIVTTNETNCCFELPPCQEYIITVTPFSPSLGYVGASNGTSATVEGDNYYFKEDPCVLSEVEFVDNKSVTVFFVCQVAVPEIPCPHQYLHIIITAETQDTEGGMLPINSTAYSGGSETYIVIKASGLLAGKKYHTNFSITDVNGDVVDTVKTSLPFSTFNVQNATFLHPRDSRVVNITCRFATGALASACMAYFENTSIGLGFIGNVSYDASSSVWSRNVSIPQEVLGLHLSRVVFDAKVYDVDMNGNIKEKPALELKGGLKIELDNAESSPDTSTHATEASTSAIPSVASTEVPSYVAIAVVVPLVLLLAVAGCVALLLYSISWYMYKRKAKSVIFPHQVRTSQITESSLGAPRSHSSANDGGVVVSEVTSFTTNAENTQYHVHEEGVHPQGSHEDYESGPLTLHPNFIVSNGISPSLHSTTPPSYNYSFVKRPRPDVPPRPLEVDGIEVEHVHVEKEGTGECAELGARPGSGSAPALPVRPLETMVQYMDKDTDSNGFHGSVPHANHPNIVGGGEKMPHTLHSPTPSANYSSEVCEKKFELAEKKSDHVVYAELGARSVYAPPVLPPEPSVHYMDVNVKCTPKAIASITSSPNIDEKEGEPGGIKKQNAVYAELGVQPCTAPPVLPPEPSVLYMTVKPTCTTNDTDSHGVHGSSPDVCQPNVNDGGGNEKALHSDIQDEDVDSHLMKVKPSLPETNEGKGENVQEKKDDVEHAELGGKADTVPPVLPCGAIHAPFLDVSLQHTCTSMPQHSPQHSATTTSSPKIDQKESEHTGIKKQMVTKLESTSLNSQPALSPDASVSKMDEMMPTAKDMENLSSTGKLSTPSHEHPESPLTKEDESGKCGSTAEIIPSQNYNDDTSMSSANSNGGEINRLTPDGQCYAGVDENCETTEGDDHYEERSYPFTYYDSSYDGHKESGHNENSEQLVLPSAQVASSVKGDHPAGLELTEVLSCS